MSHFCLLFQLQDNNKQIALLQLHKLWTGFIVPGNERKNSK